MPRLLEDLVHRQRKLFVTGCAGLVLVGGFIFAAMRPAALEAYRVLAEWTTYLAGLFGGANALAYWAQRPGGRPPSPPAGK